VSTFPVRLLNVTSPEIRVTSYWFADPAPLSHHGAEYNAQTELLAIPAAEPGRRRGREHRRYLAPIPSNTPPDRYMISKGRP
jgi:hypothetical protein